MAKLIALAAALVFGTAAVGVERPAQTHFFHAGFGDLKEELELARAEKKLGVFIMYAAEDCPPCIRIKQTILSQPEVQDRFRRLYRVVHIDFNGDVEVTDFEGRTMRSKEYAQKVAKIRGTPSFAVHGLNGQELLRHYGPVRDVAEFMLFADYVEKGVYRRRSFADYRRERVAAAGG